MSEVTAGILYLVATPIGNLGDISARALETLRQASAVVCEDTRVTAKLLNHYAIKKPTLAWHHHSEPAVLENIIKRLLAGDSLAYVSDAGTPGISDPGGKLAAAAAAAGIRLTPIPGPSAVTTALSVAGLAAERYLFMGFPPHKKGRQTFFKEVALSQYPVVFYESTHRIVKALQQLAELLPERQLVVARELTKKFETIYRGQPAEIIEQLNQTSTKGEFVVIVAPSK
jgi:16S rRNA (cytidine1402-2'-O)-methyltransferase